MRHVYAFFALLLCAKLFAQTTVNNFTVKTNLSIAGAPPTLSATTIADLKTLNPVVDDALVDVAGYLTAGDGGGGTFRRVSSSGITNLVAISAVSTFNTNFAWLRVWDNTTVRPEWFGGFPNDGVDDAAAINNALNYVAALTAGTVQLSAGQYEISTTILVPYRANLRGADGWRWGSGVSSVVGNINYLGSAPTTIRLMNGANTNMLTFNSTTGPVAQAGDIIEDGETVDNIVQNSLVENICFFGNASSQTRGDCHGIVSRAKWYARINNCSFQSIKGYCIFLFDGNVLRLTNLFLVGNGGSASMNPSKGMFVYSVSDTIFNTIEAGNFNGPSVWYNGSSSWLTLFSDSLIYNNWQTNSIWTVSSWTTNTVANFASTVPLETGDPVELRTTGNLPTGFSDTQLYFAVKLSTTAFGLHTNRALAYAGTYLAGSGAASGTNYFTIGEPSGLYASGSARYNTFVNIRADQNSGPGITFRNAYGNHVYGLEAYDNTGPAPQSETIPDLSKTGVLFDKDAYNNNVFGTIATQPIGFVVRSNAYNNSVNATYTSVLTNFVNVSTGTNQLPVSQSLSGALTATNATFVSGADIGNSAQTTSLNLYGNATGQRMVKMYRTSGITQTTGIGVSAGGASIFDETGNNAIADLNNSGTTSRIFIGPRNTAAPFAAVVSSAEAAGTNIPGAPVRIQADLSTGNADLTDAFAVLTGDAGASGTTQQSPTSKFVVEGDGDVRLSVGDLYISTAGKGIRIKEGSNAKMGTATLTAGSVVVSTTAVASTSRVFLTSQSDGGTPGFLRVSTRVNGTSFTITSSSVLDTSTVAWVILDPAP